MPEVRKDPLLDQWVIYSRERAQRPHDFQSTSERAPDADCPFCEGNEGQTPNETFAIREPANGANGPGWRVRVVSNKYPALVSEESTDPYPDDLYSHRGGGGVHEVIIESPRHLLRLTELADDEIAEVFRVYRHRLAALRADPRIRYGMLFKNVGSEAGASLEHGHSQLVGLPLVPPLPRQEWLRSQAYFQQHGQSIWSRILSRELGDERRVVGVTPRFVSFCPYASRFSFETWILARRPQACFDDVSDADFRELALLVRDILGRIERVLPCPSYNLLLRTAPFDAGPHDHYQWHIEILPRIARVAGFEWGTGCYINSTFPEEAALALRTAET